ncbi:predicted protein [Naegleria gruberi]|uniref:Predicted protein n=1 Tax=Naegleria gruberi TaxID=5762 RepID=D2VT09_NAEGR|nr:uncharacterized protein NAEGRDRAFT_72132 [Naegleria gruberi]EFC40001.1 predicted protein [Naegleria gruberi]|eukprot:XP_002672745.1 predicted protein [Naegleria gruberi strain NEG-M]
MVTNKDPKERLLEVCKDIISYYNSYQDKTQDFCQKITAIFESFVADKRFNSIFLEKDVAAVYSDCLINPKYGIKLTGHGGIWKLVNFQHIVTKETTKQFVDIGLLDMFNQLNATTVDCTNTSYTTSIMNIYHVIGTQKEYARLVVRPVIALILKLENSSYEARNYMNYLFNIVGCDRERIFEEYGKDLEEVNKKFEKNKNQTIKQLLFDLFGTKNAEFVSLLIDYAGTKKKYSFPIDNEIETTVEDVTQFILEKCVMEDVDVIESHELQIYDMDIEDYVDFDFIDSDIFGKDGNAAKFKLNVTIDYDKKRKKEEKRESELRELSEKSISSINLSEKSLADSVPSSHKFDSSIASSGIEMSSMEMSAMKDSGNEISGIPMSGIQMSGIEMSGIQMSGVEMSGIEMSGFSSSHSISGHNGPLEMPSFISAAENAPKVELTENSLLGGSFEIPDSFKEPVVTSQKDKKTKKIVNETYQILDKIESNESMIDRKVYIAKDLANKSGPNIVIKYLPIKSTTEFNRCMKEGVNMIRMGRTIQQKKIPLANIFDVFEEEDKEKNKASIRFLCFAMPYYGSGNLQTYLESKNQPSLDWNFIYSLFKQIVNGLVYLHEQNIAHKNLKLSNVFFVDEDKIVLTDYGLNSDISSQVPEHNSLSNVENIPIEKFQKADIYQAGLIFASLCLLLNGNTVSNLTTILKEGESSLRNSLGKIPEKAKDMAVKLLTQDPNERPSIQQVVNLLDI